MRGFAFYSVVACVCLGAGARLALAAAACRAGEVTVPQSFTCDKQRYELPVADQGDTKLCYAFAAAQLIDFYRFSHGNAECDLTSPVHLAYLQRKHDSWKKRTLDRGDVGDALAFGKSDGTCSSSSVEGVLRQRAPGYSGIDFIAGMQQAYLAVDEITLAKDPVQIAAVAQICHVYGPLATETIRAEHYRAVGQALDTAFPVFPKKWLDVDKAELMHRSMKAYFDTIMFQACPDSQLRKDPYPEPVSFVPNATSTIADTLDSMLCQASPHPVALTYCRNVLFDRDYRSIDWSRSDPTRYTDRKGCGLHASVVLGRRVLHQGGRDKVQYLVRNSMGGRCRKSNSPWPCTKDGDLWVDAEPLLANTSEVAYIPGD